MFCHIFLSLPQEIRMGNGYSKCGRIYVQVLSCHLLGLPRRRCGPTPATERPRSAPTWPVTPMVPVVLGSGLKGRVVQGSSAPSVGYRVEADQGHARTCQATMPQ